MNGKIKNPTILCILDGWGISKNNFKNAVKNAYTPNFDYLNNIYPSTQILASGTEVGLPEGQVGNSEVGHMNIGCGRVFKQNLLRINDAIKFGSFKEHNLINNSLDCLFLNKQRSKAINSAEKKQYDVAILDDGFQDYSIKKDLNILCFNSNQLIGNGMTLPSGPLRESLTALKKTQIVLINGNTANKKGSENIYLPEMAITKANIIDIQIIDFLYR